MLNTTVIVITAVVRSYIYRIYIYELITCAYVRERMLENSHLPVSDRVNEEEATVYSAVLYIASVESALVL